MQVLDDEVISFLCESEGVIRAKENQSIDDLDSYIRVNVLENGKTFEHVDFTRKEMAYLYIYTYLLMHMGSYEQMLKEQEYLFFDKIFNDNVLFVDFGCGCATSLLAIYSYVKEMKSLPWDTVASLPSNLTYIGKDINDELLESAIKLTKKTFNNYFTSYENHADSDEKCVIITTDIDNIGYKNIIFNFAYILSQNGIEEYIEEFVEKISDLINRYDCNYYLTYQNYYCRKNYRKLTSLLAERKLVCIERDSKKNGSYSYQVIRNLNIANLYENSSKHLNYSIAQIVKGG